METILDWHLYSFKKMSPTTAPTSDSKQASHFTKQQTKKKKTCDDVKKKQYFITTLYRMESQTQKMSTITGFSSSGSRWSGIPCQKWSRKFWI